MIKNIIFDFGGVIVRGGDAWSYFAGHGLSKEDITFYYQNVHKYTHKDESLGLKTNEELIKIYCGKYPDKKELIEFMDAHLSGWYVLSFEVVDYIKDLKKQGFKIYGITNLGLSKHNSLRDQYFKKTGENFDEIFDGVVHSYQSKLRKPDREIYELLLNTYNINPKESIFIDDVLEYAQGAEKLGIKGLQWTEDDNLESIKLKVAKIVEESKN